MGASAVAQAQNANFGGYYYGVQAGVGQNTATTTDLDWWYTGAATPTTSVRPMLGLKFGYDVVNNAQIYGYLVEGSVAAFNSQKEVGTAGDAMFKSGSKVSALGSLRGKWGVVSDKLSVFGTAGLALADIKHKYHETDGSDERFNGKGKSTGYVFGVGAAYALSDKNFIGFDVSRYAFGGKKHELLDSNGDTTNSFFGMKDRFDVISVSYNVKF